MANTSVRIDHKNAFLCNRRRGLLSACHEVETLARIGDKWTVMVVGALSRGPIRYNEIRRGVGGISQRMLTLTLKGLEQGRVGHPHDVSNDSTPRGLRVWFSSRAAEYWVRARQLRCASILIERRVLSKAPCSSTRHFHFRENWMRTNRQLRKTGRRISVWGDHLQCGLDCPAP
jgi:hypothetical protein